MLPIEEHRGEIVAALAAGRALVLKAPPGAGKTTGVPPMLVNAPETADLIAAGQVWLVQPRRLAARTAAERIAATVGGGVGRHVGFHVRGQRRVSRDTRVVAMTTGMAMQYLQNDPFAEAASVVILDEFHERSVEMDLLLARLLQLRTAIRDDLRLVVMSATMDPRPIAKHIDVHSGVHGDDSSIGGAVTITTRGRMYPVEVRYGDRIDWQRRDRMDQLASAVLAAATGQGDGREDGDVLVFLPGVAEIRSVADRVSQFEGEVRQLYGSMTPAQQDAALRPSERRRLFLSTNVAETSLTIDGVTMVVDSGKARVMTFDAAVSLPRLRLSDISVASADQRAGRAGRTRPGVAVRLWPANQHRFRKLDDAPEIRRGDLAGPMLSILRWGERVADLPWLTPPRGDSVAAAEAILRQLGAVDVEGGLTKWGEAMAELPVHPRLAAMMIRAGDLGCRRAAAEVAVLMSIEDPTRRAGANRARTDRGGAEVSIDLLDRLAMIRRGELPRGATKHFDHEVDRLLRRSPGGPDAGERAFEPEELGRCVLAGFGDRLCRRRADDAGRGVMAGGRGVRLAGRGDGAGWLGQSELFVALDIDGEGEEARVRLAMAVRQEWIEPAWIETVREYEFDAGSGRVRCRGVRRCGGLELARWPEKTEPGAEAAKILADRVGDDVMSVLPVEGKAASILRRWRWAVGVGCETIPPVPKSDRWRELVESVAVSATSMEQLRRAGWVDYLSAEIGYEHLSELDRLAPVQMTVPGGRTVPLMYPRPGDGEGSRVRIEARIGELFGWTRTPRLAGGRVPLQIHLLSPAGRVEQITDDLQHFWAVTYSAVRKDLRGRYPKHHWPEDPSTATATRNGLQPRPPK